MKVEIESPEEILEMLMAITRLDFDKKLKTTTGSSIENVISMGLNSLSDALKENVIDKQKYYESEQRFKALAKSVPGFFSYIDKDYTYQFINENYLTHFKVAEEEIIGRTMIELLGEEYFIKIKKHFDKALEGEVVKYNDTFTFKEKNIMHIHATYVPDFNSKNEVKGLYVLVQDTTILVESQKHRSIFENFFNNSPDIFTVASIKGDILLVNKSFESILGWTKDATSKKNFLDFVHPRDIKRTTQEFAKLEDKNHQTFGFENQYQTINGDWKWIRWNAINAQSKDVIYAIGTDITEQKNQDKKLDESYQTYMKLFKNASVGIILIEASSGVILTINQQGAGQLDYNTEELTGQNITKIIPESLYQHYQDVLTNETNLDIESIQLTKDGELIPVSVSATSVIIEETEVYQAFVKDIRSRRAMEAKLAQEKKISYQFQSRLLSSQLNPHFIFNVLNSFQFYLLEKNLEQSLEFVASFSTIMREVLENSTKEFITCEEEITFLEKFLTLSQERNVGKFKFNIQTCSAFDPKKDLIPPMLIQPFVENSLIHGFSDLETEGYLEILFKKEGKTTIVEISDNGVGKENSSIRKGPAPQGHKTSLGMSLIENRIKLLNEIHEYDFRLKTGELDPNQKNKGTHVEIKYNNIN